MFVWCLNFTNLLLKVHQEDLISVTVKFQVSRRSSSVLGSLDHSSRGGGGLSNEASDPSKLSGAAPARPNLGCWQMCTDDCIHFCFSIATAAWMPRSFWSKSDINSLHSSVKTRSSIHCPRKDCGREILKRCQPVADGSSSSRTTWCRKQMSFDSLESHWRC